MTPQNNFLKRLERRRAATTATEPPQDTETSPPAQQPEPLPSDPEARSAWLSDQVSDLRSELEKEREQRIKAERRLEQVSEQPRSLQDVLRQLGSAKRRTWR